jgi:hypothetical protein
MRWLDVATTPDDINPPRRPRRTRSATSSSCTSPAPTPPPFEQVDGSGFPTSLGVKPQESIDGLARLMATRMSAQTRTG